MQKKASPAQQQELWQLLRDPQQAEAFRSLIAAEMENHTEPYTITPQQADAVFRKVLEHQGVAPETLTITQRPPVRSFRRYYVAAACLLLVATGAALWFSQRSGQQVAVNKRSVVMPDIPPGKSGAVLTLEDGRTVLLDTARNGNVLEAFAKQDGSLSITTASLQYATLKTPNGRTMQLVLADGSRVWLNAASSIRFPTAFSGNTREVSINGEAYIEVAADKSKPFLAQVANAGTVEVLGTSFNVNAYNTERAVTLIQGAVKVKTGATQNSVSTQQNSVVLAPGQQAMFAERAAAQSIQVRNADTDKVLAWKNGLFQFDNAGITEVMDEIKRWYNIEVVYEKNVPDIYFGGKMSRDLSLAELLRGLNASEVHFRIEEEGRRLVIMP